MGCLGVHFALTSAQTEALWSAYEAQDDDRVLAVVREIEEAWDEAHLQETDKAWDAIHRVLSDGTLASGGDTWPLSGAVLGGECMYFRDDHVVRFVDAEEVAGISAALATVTYEWFAARFATIKDHGYAGSADASDLEYTWHWFQAMRSFFAKTSAEQRSVMFSADQ